MGFLRLGSADRLFFLMEQWVLKPENSLVWHKEVLDWINRYAFAEGDECASVVEKTGSMKI